MYICDHWILVNNEENDVIVDMLHFMVTAWFGKNKKKLFKLDVYITN